jgi:mRNA interferase MazF
MNEIKLKVNIKDIVVRRGDIWNVHIPKLEDANEKRRSLQKGDRPFLVTSNDVCNIKSGVINGVFLTSSVTKATLPTHVEIGAECGLRYDSVVLCEQPSSVDKVDLDKKVGCCTEAKMCEVEMAMKIQSGLLPKFSMELIENKVFMIRKSKEMYDASKHEDFYKMYRFGISELRRYCNDYLKDYTRYYNDKNDYNNTQSNAI